MSLLDVNALIALAWDSHVHHVAIRRWFSANCREGWATSPITESGFVRVSSNPKVLPAAIGIPAAREVIHSLRNHPHHHFLTDDVSITDHDFPEVFGHQQITDAHLLVLARRNRMTLVTFDTAIHKLAGGEGVDLLTRD